MGVDQPGENSNLLVSVEFRTILRRLHASLQPIPNPRVIDVHKLHADRPAVGIVKLVKNLAQSEGSAQGHRLGREELVHVGVRESEEFRLQSRFG